MTTCAQAREKYYSSALEQAFQAIDEAAEKRYSDCVVRLPENDANHVCAILSNEPYNFIVNKYCNHNYPNESNLIISGWAK